MKILLDTHIYIDWVEQLRFSTYEIQTINQLNRKGNVFISSIIFWEIALLAEKSKESTFLEGGFDMPPEGATEQIALAVPKARWLFFKSTAHAFVSIKAMGFILNRV